MGEFSKIQWTTHTFNAWIGCSKVSAACKNCYAANETFVRVQRGRGLELWGPKAERHVTSPDNWKKPLRWNRLAAAAGERHRVFCSSLSDVFERRDGAVGATLDGARARLWTLIERTPNLDWLLLTKRPENVMGMVPEAWRTAFPRSIWLGTTCEDQERADERIPHLLQCPAAVLFVSYEPALGPVQFDVLRTGDFDSTNALTGEVSYAGRGSQGGHTAQRYRRGLDWVIVGGESGPGARPFNMGWARSIRDQCKAAGVAFFCKQLGADPFEIVCDDVAVGAPPRAKHARLLEDLTVERRPWMKDRKGGDWNEWPADLRVREFPKGSA